MAQKVRWGVLGNAWIARDFMIPALEKSEICSLAAVASRGKFPAEIAPNAKHYDSYEALLADPEIDAIYVPVPNALHKKWTIAALEAGKHVLCEKPIACTAAEAEEMIAAAQKSGKLLMEAFMYRYGGKFRKMMEILQSGVLGKIRAVQGSHGYTLDWASPAREDPALGGGSMYDVGCYVVDCMNAVAKQQGGKLVDAKAVTMGTPVDYHAAAALSYDCGILGVLESWFDAAQEQRVLIAGEKGTLCIPMIFEGGGGEMYLKVGDRLETIGIPNADPYQLEAEAFSRAVLGEDNDLMPLEDTLSNMQTLDKLYNR
jgi:predicted dehydrogenase